MDRRGGMDSLVCPVATCLGCEILRGFHEDVHHSAREVSRVTIAHEADLHLV